MTLISKSVLNKEIKSLTVDFDDETFLFFHTHNSEKVNIVEGFQGEFPEIQYSVKNNLLFENSGSSDTKVEDTNEIVCEEPTTDLIATLHKSMLPSLDNLVDIFGNVEAYLQPYQDPGGDFLWYKNYNNGKCLVILGDCTGHGVQGAMIAMSVVTLLKQSFNQCPENLLDTVYSFYDQMADLLEDDNRAGFDSEMGFMFFDTENNSVEFTGNGINMIHRSGNNKVTVHQTRYIQLFKRRLGVNTIDLQKGDQLMIFTDGITDQYDNENKRKLGRKKLRDMVSSLSKKSTLNDFLKRFNAFRGDVKQMDDQSMLVITI